MPAWAQGHRIPEISETRGNDKPRVPQVVLDSTQPRYQERFHETFLGHNTGYAGDYNKQTDEDKLEFYESGMHALTISDEDRLKVKVQEHDKMIGAAAEILKYAQEHDIKIGL